MIGQKSNIKKHNPRLIKDGGFTVVLNRVVQHINDLEVLGLYVYLSSLPPEWEINKNHLRKHFKIGERKIDSLFKKLRELNLLILEEYREKGKFVGVNYRLCLDFHRTAETAPAETAPTEMYPPIKEIYNKENNNKESNTFSITKESEIEKVIQKAQECLEKTKENLPSKASEIVPYEYQETNLPAKVNLKPLTVLQEINSLDLPDEYLDELIKIRKVNGGKVTKKALSSVYQELIKLKKAGLDLNECLSMYANCGWKGFVADWFINAIKGKKNPYDFYTSNDTSWGDEMKNDPFFQGMLG